MGSDRVRQRTVYWVTAALVACLIGGYAMAAFSTGGINTTQQGSQTTTVGPIQGLTWLSTNLTELTTAQASGNCVSGSPCDLSPGGSAGSFRSCVGGFSVSGTPLACAATDFVEQVNLTTNANGIPPPPSMVQLTVFVTGTAPGGTSAVTVACLSTYYEESTGAPTVASTITLDFDVGSISTGPGLVTSVTVIGNVL